MQTVADVSGESSSNSCEMSNKFSESILQWCSLITKYAKEQNIDPNLIGAVMLQESGGNPNAISVTMATGLMQVEPRDSGYAVFVNRPSMQELLDPEFNIKYGVGMLANLNNKYGNMRDALFHYGPIDVGYEGYADKILSIYENMK